ncbi:MAG TPA: hypothetical protein DCQ31_03735, partial [Bacteroidales bacterium]|nr:hypothetical protein [Bacteroidales bacterium]
MSKQYRDSILISIISYFGAAIGYINKILLFPNFLSTEEVGLANILVSIAAIYAQFSALGISSITLKFFPYFRNKEKAHNGFLFWANALLHIGFLLTTIAFIALKPIVVTYYSKNSQLLIDFYYYLIPLSLLTLYYNFFESYLRSLYKTVFPAFVYEVILRLGITLAISAFALKLINFEGFVTLYVIIYAIPPICLLFYTVYLKQFLFSYSISTPLVRLRKIIPVYGLYSFLNNASNLILLTIDSLMLAVMMNLSSAGIYSTMLFLASVMQIPFRAIGKTNGPIVSDFWRNNDLKGLSALYVKVSSLNLLISGWLFLLLWCNFTNFMQMLPAEYAAGMYVFLIIGLARMFDSYTGLNGLILVTSNKFRIDLLFTFLLALITIILNYLFIPGYGMEGAAFATMLSTVIYNMLRL